MPRKSCVRSKKTCRRGRGGSEITKLQLDPYYIQKKLRGRGIKDWFSSKSDEDIERLNAEILADIAAAKALKTKKSSSQSTTSTSAIPYTETTQIMGAVG